MSDATKRAARWLLALGAMALSFWLLARELDWPQVAAALRQAEYGWVAAGALAIVATFWTRAERWRALLWRAELRLWPTMTALLVGQAANLVLPMRGGDLVRAAWIRPEPGTGGSEALGSVALEKVWDLVALLLCRVLLLPLIPLPPWFAHSAGWTALALVLGGAVLWAALRWQDVLFRWAGALLARFPAGWDAALLPRLRRLAQGLDSLRDARVSARALAWSLATWGLGGAANWAVMRAFGVESVAAAILLLAALMVGGAVIPTPGRLGVFEGICVVVLAGFAVDGDVALAVGLALHLVVMGPPLVAAALLALLHPVTRRADETP